MYYFYFVSFFCSILYIIYWIPRWWYRKIQLVWLRISLIFSVRCVWRNIMRIMRVMMEDFRWCYVVPNIVHAKNVFNIQFSKKEGGKVNALNAVKLFLMAKLIDFVIFMKFSKFGNSFKTKRETHERNSNKKTKILKALRIRSTSWLNKRTNTKLTKLIIMY